MSIIFLSYFLGENTPAYGGAEGTVLFEKSRSISNGDTSNNLYLKFPNHIGTHIDFPRHFSNEGKSINDYPAEFWIFNRVGFIHSDMDSLELNCEDIPNDIELLIVKTGFGDQRN
jgi:arylformamidase